MLGAVRRWLADLFFPLECRGCGKDGQRLCRDCLFRFPIRLAECCPWCARESNLGQVCLGCIDDSPLSGLITIFDYQVGTPGAALIQDFKYQFARDLGPLWRRLFQRFFEVYPLVANFLQDSFVFIPVPLHARRLRERGFNQALVLANALVQAPGSGAPSPVVLESGFYRILPTAQQARLAKNERQANLQGAFVWQGASVPSRIMLVDDVITTGATVRAAAEALKAAGAQEVWAMGLARG